MQYTVSNETLLHQAINNLSNLNAQQLRDEQASRLRQSSFVSSGSGYSDDDDEVETRRLDNIKAYQEGRRMDLDQFDYSKLRRHQPESLEEALFMLQQFRQYASDLERDVSSGDAEIFNQRLQIKALQRMSLELGSQLSINQEQLDELEAKAALDYVKSRPSGFLENQCRGSSRWEAYESVLALALAKDAQATVAIAKASVQAPSQQVAPQVKAAAEAPRRGFLAMLGLGH